MAVVTLAPFIVITDHAFFIDHVGQTVFVTMFRWRQGLRESPDHYFGEGIFGQYLPSLHDEGCFHVGENNNTFGPCQTRLR